MRIRLAFLPLIVLPFLGTTGTSVAAEAGTTNGRIIFVSADRNGIASMNPDGSGIWGLMLGGNDGEPSWSADGSRLAVAVRWPGIEGITVMDPQGWISRRRLTFSASDSHPSWSPDGTTIAFSGNGDIALVPAAGGSITRITSGPELDLEPSWSPDGTTIAFTRNSLDGTSVWTFDVATGKAVLAVSGDPFGAAAPSWSPRGELTYVVGDTAYARSADGRVARLVTPVDYGTSIAWAPDGSRFLFVSGGGISVAGRDGEVLGRLAPGTSPAWQPLPDTNDGCTLRGTAGADILVGTPGNDILCGLAGDDTLLGLDGADLIMGGPGNDWIAGGQANDRLLGQAGSDRLDARDGRTDTVDGGAGTDTGLVEPRDGTRSVERRRLDGNLAAWRPVRASGLGIPDPPERAVDGLAGDAWNSGGWPPAWIEVDLLRPTDIGTIRLVTGPQPAGVTHLVLGKGPSTRGAYRLLRVIKGPTAAGQEVVLGAGRPWLGIRWLRIATDPGGSGSAQWVSWQEIEVYAPSRR